MFLQDVRGGTDAAAVSGDVQPDVVELGFGYDQASEQLRTVIAADPSFCLAHSDLGWVYEKKGMLHEAVYGFQKSVDLCGGEDWGKLALVYAYAVAGQAGQARRILAEWQSAVRPAPVPSLPLTLVYIALGDRERALASLQQALAQHQAGGSGD